MGIVPEDDRPMEAGPEAADLPEVDDDPECYDPAEDDPYDTADECGGPGPGWLDGPDLPDSVWDALAAESLALSLLERGLLL